MKMSQADNLYFILRDGQPHRSDDLVKAVYGEGMVCPECGNRKQMSLARLGARVFDVKRKHNVNIQSYPDPQNRKLWWYVLKLEGEQVIQKIPAGTAPHRPENLQRLDTATGQSMSSESQQVLQARIWSV